MCFTGYLLVIYHAGQVQIVLHYPNSHLLHPLNIVSVCLFVCLNQSTALPVEILVTASSGYILLCSLHNSQFPISFSGPHVT